MSRYPKEWESNLLTDSNLSTILGSELINELRELHNAQGRFYHNWDHALDVLRATLLLPLPRKELTVCAIAAVFHDVIYSYGREDNESNSAVFLKSFEHLPRQLVVAAVPLILATSTHLVSSVKNTSPLERDFLDCDILTIASPHWPIAKGYDDSIFDEAIAAGNTPEQVMVGRRKFLETMLAKPMILLGRYYGPTNEWQARANIQRLLTHHAR